VKTTAALAVALVVAGCGSAQVEPAAEDVEGLRELGPRYGMSITLPPGWHGRISRGAVQAATFPLRPQASGWVHEAETRRLAEEDVVVTLFETAPENTSPPINRSEYPPLTGPLALEAAGFESWDGITTDSKLTGRGFGHKAFGLSGRLFVAFVETGSWPPAPAVLAGLNEVLGSLEVERGNFYPGIVEPSRFTPQPGWYVGDSGPTEVDADGELVTAWAATIPWADDWNALPASKTLRDLPRDGIAMWVLAERNNRYISSPNGDAAFPNSEPPFRLSDFEHRPMWEGQMRNLPEYVLWRTVRGEYRIDLRVYFGRPDPSGAMREEAQAMLDGLELPDWGPWELEP
jgi:hypothetical protein